MKLYEDPSGYELFNNGIIEYPYNASKERSDKITKNIDRLKSGMTTFEVRKLLSNPDEMNPTYTNIKPRKKFLKNKDRPDICGWSYVYIIRRFEENGSVNSKKEILIRIHFNRQSRTLIQANAVGLSFKDINKE